MRRLGFLTLLSDCYTRRCNHTESTRGLDDAIETMQQALNEVPDSHRCRGNLLAMMAEKYRVRGAVSWEQCEPGMPYSLEDLQEAIKYAQEARSRGQEGSRDLNDATIV